MEFTDESLMLDMLKLATTCVREGNGKAVCVDMLQHAYMPIIIPEEYAKAIVDIANTLDMRTWYGNR